MPLKWIPRSKSGASKSRPRWAAHTRIGNVWEYPPGVVSRKPEVLIYSAGGIRRAGVGPNHKTRKLA